MFAGIWSCQPVSYRLPTVASLLALILVSEVAPFSNEFSPLLKKRCKTQIPATNTNTIAITGIRIFIGFVFLFRADTLWLPVTRGAVMVAA